MGKVRERHEGFINIDPPNTVDDVALAAKENKPEPGSQPEEAAEDNMSNGARGTRDAGGAAGPPTPTP